MTGHAHGPHLHFEVRIDGHAVDPRPCLALATLLGDVDSCVMAGLGPATHEFVMFSGKAMGGRAKRGHETWVVSRSGVAGPNLAKPAMTQWLTGLSRCR